MGVVTQQDKHKIKIIIFILWYLKKLTFTSSSDFEQIVQYADGSQVPSQIQLLLQPQTAQVPPQLTAPSLKFLYFFSPRLHVFVCMFVINQLDQLEDLLPRFINYLTDLSHAFDLVDLSYYIYMIFTKIHLTLWYSFYVTNRMLGGTTVLYFLSSCQFIARKGVRVALSKSTRCLLQFQTLSKTQRLSNWMGQRVFKTDRSQANKRHTQ